MRSGRHPETAAISVDAARYRRSRISRTPAGAAVAIGSPGEDTLVSDAGGINVVFGSTAGITATGNQLFQGIL